MALHQILSDDSVEKYSIWQYGVLCCIAVMALGLLAFYHFKLAVVGCFLGLVSLLFLRPMCGYLLILLFFPVQAFFFMFNGDFHKHLLISDFCIITTGLSWMLSRLSRQIRPYPGTNADWILALFLLWSIISIIWSPDSGQGLIGITRLMICCLIFMLTVALLESKNIFLNTVKFFALVGLGQGILCIFSIYTSYGVDYSITLFPGIEFSNKFWSYHLETWVPSTGARGLGMAVPHTSAIFLNMVIFLSVGLVITEAKKGWRFFWGFVTIVNFTGMMATLTKSTLLSLWVGFGCFFLLFKPLRKFLLTSIAGLIIISAVLFLVARAPEISMSIKYTSHQMNAGSKDSSLGSRLSWWSSGMEKLIDTNGLGFGIGGFMGSIDNPVPDGTHAAVLFDFGLVGMFLWIALFVNGAVTFYKHHRDCEDTFFKRFLAVYLGGYIMMMIAWIVTLHYDYIDLYFYFGLGYAIVNLKKQSKASLL